MFIRALVTILGAVALQASAAPLSLNSERALVLDRDTGEMLYSKQSDSSAPIASVTKLLTAMVVLDEHPNMAETLEITQNDVDVVKHSKSRLAVGTRLSRAQMLHLALMSSENRAAHALARTSKKGLAGFVMSMNLKAQLLDMSGSYFVDPTGLSPKNRASAEDLGKLVVNARKYEAITEYTTTTSDSVKVGKSMMQFRNTNPVVGRKGWDVWLSKTGFITEAGRCVVVGFNRAGKNLAVVLMGAGTSSQREQDLVRVHNFYGPSNSVAALATVKREVRKEVQTLKLAAEVKTGSSKVSRRPERKTAAVRSKRLNDAKPVPRTAKSGKVVKAGKVAKGHKQAKTVKHGRA